MAKIFLISFLLFCSFNGYSQSVDFTYQTSDGTFCSPTRVSFTATATGSPTGYVWNFGNGMRSYTANPTITYATSGNFLVQVIALYANGVAEKSKRVVISPKLSPSLTANRVYICQPGTIDFNTASNGVIASYDWDYGDTSGITSGSTSNSTHNFTRYGTFNVVVQVTDTAGCKGVDTLMVEVKKLPFTATATPPSGCVPAAVTFSANTVLPQTGSVSNYVWDFGDGTTPVSTTSASVNHTYPNVGSFFPVVNVTTNEGCTNVFNFSPVAYGTPPVNLVAFPRKTIVCGSETSEFISRATNANRYVWNFGDGNGFLASDTVVRHKFATLGIKTVTVTPYFNDCPGNSTSFQVEVIGVIADYIYSNSCTDKKTFFFTNSTQGNQSSITWTYGDSSSIDSSINTVHTYPDTGAFVTILKVTDSITGCVDSAIKTLYTSEPILVNTDSSICRNSSTVYELQSSYSNPAASYQWNVLGKQIFNSSPTLSVTGEILGTFNNYVVIQNGVSTYCPDTVNLGRTTLVRGPNLGFDIPGSICLADSLNINNTSSPFIPTDSITGWYWKYGNSDEYDTIRNPRPVPYTAAGDVDVQLYAVDNRGCGDSLTKKLTVNYMPFLHLVPRLDTVCGGSSDTLLAFHDGNILWSPAAGLSCDNCDTVLAGPATTTKYYITATTIFNCSVRDSVLMTVYPSFTAQPVQSDPYICQNDDFILDMNPKDKRIVWSPAAGLSNPNIYNPVARPTQTTTYRAILTDSIGCFTDSADITIFVKPIPQVDAGPDLSVAYNSSFTIAPVYSSNVRAYLWTPAAQLTCTTCPATGGTALTSQTYTIQVTSDSGCVAKDSINLVIDCKDAYILMPKAFTPNNDNLNDYYYPITRGVQNILRFSIYNRGGQLIYEAKNFKPNDKFVSWNGYFKGQPQSASSFVYVLEAVCDTGQRLTKSGSFMLLK